MTTAERINRSLQQLPSSIEQEVLDFVEFLLKKQTKDDREWQDFSFTQAMQGLEGDKMPKYDEKMALMQSAMSDPLFLADLEEIREDFKHADLEEVIG